MGRHRIDSIDLYRDQTRRGIQTGYGSVDQDTRTCFAWLNRAIEKARKRKIAAKEVRCHRCWVDLSLKADYFQPSPLFHLCILFLN